MCNCFINSRYLGNLANNCFAAFLLLYFLLMLVALVGWWFCIYRLLRARYQVVFNMPFSVFSNFEPMAPFQIASLLLPYVSVYKLGFPHARDEAVIGKVAVLCACVRWHL